MAWLPWIPYLIHHGPTLTSSLQVLRKPQKFERQSFSNGCTYSITNYEVKVTFNGMTLLLNFIKIYQFIPKLLVWAT
jgi:hypothetical protein